MSENGGGGQLMVKARFNFKQNNEDELSFGKGDMIIVTRQEEGGWWEGTLSGKTGWFPSNYVREIKPCGELGHTISIMSMISFKQSLFQTFCVIYKIYIQLNLQGHLHLTPYFGSVMMML